MPLRQGWFIVQMKLVALVAIHLQGLYMQSYKPNAPPHTCTHRDDGHAFIIDVMLSIGQLTLKTTLTVIQINWIGPIVFLRNDGQP